MRRVQGVRIPPEQFEPPHMNTRNGTPRPEFCLIGAERGIRTPESDDSGFRIHRTTGLCDLGLSRALCATVISMMQHLCAVLVRLSGDEGHHEVTLNQGATVRDVLRAANLLPSLYIVSHEAQVLPMSTALSDDVTLEVTRIASGG